MKYFYITCLFLIISSVANAQFKNKDKLREQTDYLLIDKTEIKPDPNGIPFYFAVLRVNGNVIEIYPFSIYYENTYKLTSSFEFNIPKNLFTADQIVELISTYKFELKDDLMIMDIKKIFSNYEKSTPLPNYITYSIEKLTVK